MAAYREACYWYKRFKISNVKLLNTVNTNIWRGKRIDNKAQGWCLDCCRYGFLTYCKSCSLYHVCSECTEYGNCFLDQAMHLLRLRTFKAPLEMKHYKDIIALYSKLFPINDDVIEKTKDKIQQNKNRISNIGTWYKHLLLPITLTAAEIQLEHDTFYIFGDFYDCSKCINVPYRIVNLAHNYDILLLDDVNLQRISMLHSVNLRNSYAHQYFRMTRMPALHRNQEILYENFTTDTLIFKDGNTERRVVRKYNEQIEKIEWNSLVDEFVNYTLEYDKSVYKSRTRDFVISDWSMLKLRNDFDSIANGGRFSYVRSHHQELITKNACDYCEIRDEIGSYQYKNILNNFTDFIRALYHTNMSNKRRNKSCSEYDPIDDIVASCIRYLYNDEMYELKLKKLFYELKPIKIDDTSILALNYRLHIDMFEIINKALNTTVPPRFYSLEAFSKICKQIYNVWYNNNTIRKLPLCTNYRVKSSIAWARDTLDHNDNDYMDTMLFISDDDE
uniref:Non-structural protein 1 n=1 Tax=Rotavirus A TaxID=28875 RepID=A0A6M3QV95_9REOV|nr:NSP1 [Rotavirus A]